MLMQSGGVNEKSVLCAAERVDEALHLIQLINVTSQRLISEHTHDTDDVMMAV